MIRKATSEDFLATVDIYNQAIVHRCTGDTQSLTAQERTPWFEQRNNPRTPIYVYESGGKVVAYGYIASYRYGRPAFAGVGEVAYYVDFCHHRKGIGNQMLEFLISQARTIGYGHLVAILLGSNEKSISLLRKYGFALWGDMPGVAVIDGVRHSHVYYGRELLD